MTSDLLHLLLGGLLLARATKGSECSISTQTRDSYQLCQVFSTVSFLSRDSHNPVSPPFDLSSHDLCKSELVAFISCSDEKIVKVTFNNASNVLLSGSLNFNSGLNQLPSELVEFDVSDQDLGGDFFLDAFNQSNKVETIQINNNHFTGTIDLGRVPKRLQRINLSNNDFSRVISAAPETKPFLTALTRHSHINPLRLLRVAPYEHHTMQKTHDNPRRRLLQSTTPEPEGKSSSLTDFVESPWMPIVAIALGALLILLGVGAYFYRKRWKIRRAEATRQRAETAIMEREKGLRQPSNQLTAGVHTGDVNESDWEIAEDVHGNKIKRKKQSRRERLKSKSKSKGNLKSIETSPVIPVVAPLPGSLPGNMSLVTASAGNVSYEPSASGTPQIRALASPSLNTGDMIAAARGAGGAQDRDNAGSPVALTPRSMDGKLAPSVRDRNQTLSSEMLFGSQQTFDHARRAGFHTYSHANGSKPQMKNVDSTSKNADADASTQQQKEVEVIPVPRMMSQSVAAQGGIGDVDAGASVTDMMPDADIITPQTTIGMDNNDANTRMRQITQLSPEIAAAQERIELERQERKKKNHVHMEHVLGDEVAGQGLYNQHNSVYEDGGQVDMGTTEYGNASGIRGKHEDDIDTTEFVL